MIWAFHQGFARASSSQDSEMFQSSWTSWSSKIMAEGTVERSHLIVGSFQESQYRRVYSSKSATSSPGGLLVSRRERIKSRVSCGGLWA
jgi:hypothetical protein